MLPIFSPGPHGTRGYSIAERNASGRHRPIHLHYADQLVSVSAAGRDGLVDRVVAAER
jgi:hypothetical protein